MPTFEQRLAALELSNRRLRFLALVLSVILVAVIASGAGRDESVPNPAPSSDIVRARRVEIIGPENVPTVVLESVGNTGAIRIHDARGRQLVRLGAVDGSAGAGGSIDTYCAEGEMKLVSVGLNRIGRGEIATYGPTGKPFVSIGSGAVGGMVTTVAESGHDLVRIGSVNGNGTVRTFDSDGEALVNLGVTTRGQGTVATYDGRGRPLVQIGATTREGRAAISLLEGEEGRPVAQMFIDDRGQGEFLSLTPTGDGRGLSPQGVLPVRPSAALTLLQPTE